MNVGHASGIPQARPDTGTHKLTPCNGDYGALLLEYGVFLRGILRPGCIVAYEAPILHRNHTMHTTMIACSLAAETERLCADIGGINYTAYHIGTIKKTFTGHGGAKKAPMIARARSLGFEVETDHEADAIGCWYCLLNMYDRVNKTDFGARHLDPLLLQGPNDGLLF